MKHKVSDPQRNGYVEVPSEDLFTEIEAVWRKYGVSFAYECSEDTFLIEPFDYHNVQHLRAAQFEVTAAHKVAQAKGKEAEFVDPPTRRRDDDASR